MNIAPKIFELRARQLIIALAGLASGMGAVLLLH
jgi:hypothetical protein